MNSNLCGKEHTVHADEKSADTKTWIWVTCGEEVLNRRLFGRHVDPEFIRTWVDLTLTEHTNELQAAEIARLAAALGDGVAEFADGFQAGVDSITKMPEVSDRAAFRELRRRVTPSSVDAYGLDRGLELVLLRFLHEARDVADMVLDRLVAEYLNEQEEQT